MARTIEQYLGELRAQLVSEDPALVQDALYDAEEYLRSAVAEAGDDPAAFEQIADAYGSPAEVAAAYRETELTVREALRRPERARTNPFARFFGVFVDAETYGSLFYMLLSLATGVAYFTVVVTGLSLSAGLLITLLGIPVALLLIAIVRAVSLAEGRVVEGLLGIRMPRRPRTVGQQGDIWARLKSWFTDYRTWTTMLYMLLQLPLGVAYFTTGVTGISVSLAVFAAPIIQIAADRPVIVDGTYGYLIDPWAMPLFMIAGLVLLTATMWVVRGVGYLHGQYAKAMLVGRFTGSQAESTTANV